MKVTAVFPLALGLVTLGCVSTVRQSDLTQEMISSRPTFQHSNIAFVTSPVVELDDQFFAEAARCTSLGKTPCFVLVVSASPRVLVPIVDQELVERWRETTVKLNGMPFVVRSPFGERGSDNEQPPGCHILAIEPNGLTSEDVITVPMDGKGVKVKAALVTYLRDS